MVDMSSWGDGIPDDFVITGISEEELDKNIAYLKKHPLFLKDIPENIEDNPELMALQNLMYNDTPENLAKSFNVCGD